MSKDRARRAWSRRDAACAAVVFALTVAHVLYYFPRVVDDLFISLRYAENLARGNGAVYNVGERVEGYSSPLWMLLQTLGAAFGAEGVTWTKCLGCVSLFSMEYGLFVLTRSVFRVPGVMAWAPSLFCAGNSYVVNWAVLGLETPAHLALVVLVPVAVHGALEADDRRNWGLATASIVGLGLTRPESILYLVANILGPFPGVRSRAELSNLGKKLVSLFAPAFAVLLGLLSLRHEYYGYFVPNTYFVKGGAEAFGMTKLSPLWTQGATLPEAGVYIGGTLLLAYYGVIRGAIAPVSSVLACLYFTASVRLDWMPSLRHLLPVTLLSPIGWTCFASDLARARSFWLKILGWGALSIVPVAAAQIATIDNRNSPEERKGRGWIRPKTAQKWQDTVFAYRRLEPPHITRMGSYRMGQITQAWHVLEASREPVDQSYYLGRDIGAVGYYTGVRVFDTAGLFTPEVAHSSAWTESHQVTDDLVRRAMSRKPLAGEIYEGWEYALGRHPELLRGYRIRTGSMRLPYAFLAIDRPQPTTDEVIRRYRAMVAKFPKLYDLHTLYGESVGAAVNKRLRVVLEGSSEPRNAPSRSWGR